MAKSFHAQQGHTQTELELLDGNDAKNVQKVITVRKEQLYQTNALKGNTMISYRERHLVTAKIASLGITVQLKELLPHCHVQEAITRLLVHLTARYVSQDFIVRAT